MSVSSFLVGGAPFYKLPGRGPGASGYVLGSTGENTVDWVDAASLGSPAYEAYTLDVRRSPNGPLLDPATEVTCFVSITPVLVDGVAQTRVDLYVDYATVEGILDGETQYYLQFRSTIPGPDGSQIDGACVLQSRRVAGGLEVRTLERFSFINQGGGLEFFVMNTQVGVAGAPDESRDFIRPFSVWYLSSEAPPTPPTFPDATQVEKNRQDIAALQGEVAGIEAADGDRDAAILANTEAIAELVLVTDGLAAKQTTQQSEIDALRVDVDFLLAQQPAANKYVFLNGTGGYLNFSGGGGDYLDLTKSWTVAISLEGLPDNPVDNHPISLFGSGQVSITLKRGSPPGAGNWGVYATSNHNLYQTAARWQANAWYAPGSASRVAFTYDHTTKRMAYWLQEVAGGTFARRANILVPDSAIAAQGLGNDFCFGKAWTGEGGALFSGDWWNGGVNNLIAAKEVLTDDDLAEYFQSGQPIDEMALFPKLTTWAKLGEQAYPTLLDEKGTLTGGSLIGGAPSDFKDIGA